MNKLVRARLWLYPEIDLMLLEHLGLVNAAAWLLMALQNYAQHLEVFAEGDPVQFRVNLDPDKHQGLLALLDATPPKRKSSLLRNAAYFELGRTALPDLNVDDLAVKLLNALRARGIEFAGTPAVDQPDEETVKALLKGVSQFEVG